MNNLSNFVLQRSILVFLLVSFNIFIVVDSTFVVARKYYGAGVGNLGVGVTEQAHIGVSSLPQGGIVGSAGVGVFGNIGPIDTGVAAGVTAGVKRVVDPVGLRPDRYVASGDTRVAGNFGPLNALVGVGVKASIGGDHQPGYGRTGLFKRDSNSLLLSLTSYPKYRNQLPMS